MSDEIKKCQFCELDATSMYRLFSVTSPDEPQGSLHYDYFGEAVYTCDKHALSLQGFWLDGKVMEGWSLNEPDNCARNFKHPRAFYESQQKKRDSE